MPSTRALAAAMGALCLLASGMTLASRAAGRTPPSATAGSAPRRATARAGVQPPSPGNGGASASATFVLVGSRLDTSCPSSTWTSYDRPAQFGVAVDRDVAITMGDGVVLRADVYRPAAPGRHPALLQQTAYNKAEPIGAADTYFVQRGYVFVDLDVRGTGSSAGAWDSFGPAEQRDGAEVVSWITRQPWSDGSVGLYGASYMGLTQFFTAAQRPPGLKAMFPIVPMADAYRDVLAEGGAINVEFIPSWLGLVTGTSFAPTTATTDPAAAATALSAHAGGALAFQAPSVVGATTGGDLAYDGPFYRTRSPIETVDRIDVPVFVVGGLHDIFQRGEPLLYEHLARHTTAKLLMGPWTHDEAGNGLPTGELPTDLDQLALRWFDHYLLGVANGAECVPDVTQYQLGEGRYHVQAAWPRPGLVARTLHLRAGQGLTAAGPRSGEDPDPLVQQPASGACTGSTVQWSAGALAGTPCATDNRTAEPTEQSYTTAPLTRPLHVDGPIGATLWVTTTASDATVVARVVDVAPDGTATEVTSGMLTASLRAVDWGRTRLLDGQAVQVRHPFSRASILPVPSGTPLRLDIEVFPTNAVIAAGHRLRIDVGASDFPHAAQPVPRAGGSAGILGILHDPAHPSALTLPVVAA